MCGHKLQPFYANLQYKHVRLLRARGTILPNFWAQALSMWCKTNFKPPERCSREVPLAFNSVFLCDQWRGILFNVSLMEKYSKHGVITLHDFKEKTPSWDTNLKNELQVYTVTKFIDQMFPVGFIGQGTIFMDMSKVIAVKKFNKALLDNVVREPTNIWEKWEWELEIPHLSHRWASICKLSVQFVPIKLRTFLWRFINRAFFTNAHLFEINRCDDPLCTHCGLVETFLHIYWECDKVRDLWRQLFAWCRKYVPTKEHLGCNACLLLGFRSTMLNNIIIICKYYIHTSRCFKTEFSFLALLRRIHSARYLDLQAHQRLSYLPMHCYH